MATGWTLCFTALVVATNGLSIPDPRRSRGSYRLPDQMLVDYLDQQENRPVKGPREVPDWPKTDFQFGQMAGVDVTPNNDVIIFHRGNRSWTDERFDADTSVMPENQRVAIGQDTIVRLDSKTGRVLDSFGANMFYVPHGLTVDKRGNLWLTDVGTHQVFRIPVNKTEPDLVLGKKFAPESDDTHFCKPTDVAVASNGDFFVSDGYCNSRIMKFSPTGTLLGKFGMDTVGVGFDSPYSFDVPHSLSLIEELDMLCVADRENERVLCYNAGLGSSKLGQFNRTIVPGGDIGKVYGLAYDPHGEVMHVAAVLSQVPVWDQDGFPYSPARGFTYDLNGVFLVDWDYITPKEAKKGPSIPHDIAVSPDGGHVYVADVKQHAVHKFVQPSAQPQQYFR